MHNTVKLLLILAACLLLISCVSMPSTGRAAEAPLLRVYLKRLDISDRIDLHLEGMYLLRSGTTEILFQRGTALTVELRENRLVLFLSGTAVALDSSLTLSRRDDGGDVSALRIGNSSGIYPGDLSLTVADQKIRPVLSLNMEDYLLGVVPNEMSDSYPLEALKAQAVCARTYAMRKMGRSGEWDVVDTTNDQVFRAILPSNINSARAVSETAGLVITSDGKLIEAWYSASNGGQTEIPSHIWDGSHSDCYAVQDDPWDLENPDSVTRTVELNRDGSNLYRRITNLLREAVYQDPIWQKGGFSKTAESFRVDGFTAVSVKTPRYGSPSRLMTELEVTLKASGRKETTAPGEFESAGSFTVTLKIFPDVLDALGLRVASAGNEIMTVEETETAFRLITRRYGHGVGLSQRGAQWMASSGGKTFDEIIAFYFPGSRIVRYTGEAAAIPAPDEMLATLPEEIVPVSVSRELMPVTESGLPQGAYVASVEKINDDSSLNLRSDASPAASVIMRLYKHQHLIVLDERDVPGWALVKTDTVEGYVMTSFIERVE